MNFNKPIVLRKFDEDLKEWNDVATLHARVNKTGGSEYLASGAYQSTATLTFDVRYSPIVADIFLNTQLYRVRYAGAEYDIQDYDDYEEKHRTVRLLGVARGV